MPVSSLLAFSLNAEGQAPQAGIPLGSCPLSVRGSSTAPQLLPPGFVINHSLDGIKIQRKGSLGPSGIACLEKDTQCQDSEKRKFSANGPLTLQRVVWVTPHVSEASGGPSDLRLFF